MDNNTSLKGLGPQERLFITTLASEGKRIFWIDDAFPFWPSRQQTRNALKRLEGKGWLQRISRGLYMIVPLEAGPEGHWTDDPLVIASQLAPDGAVAYWSALHYWNFTEQLPRTVMAQSLRQKNPAEIEILGVKYKFIWIVEHKFFGIASRSSNGMQVSLTDREKTLVDACDRPDLCGGILQVAQALGAGEPIDWDRMDTYLEKMGSGVIYKRLGYLVDQLQIIIPDRDARLARWQGSLSEGVSWLDRGGLKYGPVRTKWRIRVNVPEWSEA